MNWTLFNVHLLLPGFALVVFRVLGLLVTAPLFGSGAIPAKLKVCFAFAVSATVFPLVAPTVPAEITLHTALLGVFGEMIIGLIMGLTVSMVMVGVQMAGMLIGQQAGIALASAIDPTQNEQSTVVGQVYMIVTMLIFLIIGGHRLLVAALLDTFTVVPLLSFQMDPSMVAMAGDVLSAAYILAIKLFSPVLIALLLTSLTLAFLSRTMPQLNILSVGFAVRSMAAIGTAAFALAASQDLLVGAMLESLDTVRAAFGLSPLVL